MEKTHEDAHRCFGLGHPHCGPTLTRSAIAGPTDDVIVGGKFIGTDPDENVRLQLRRDAGSENY